VCTHPVILSAIAAGFVFGIVYLILYLPRKGKILDYDPGGRKGEFENHAGRYQSLAQLMFGAAAASIAFLIGFLVNIDPAKCRSVYSFRLERATPSVTLFLCLSAACGLGYALFQALFYEDYTHAKYPEDPNESRETYTAAKYAWNLTLAASGLLYFLVAYILAAAWMFAGN
jgi:hypothetical protein